MIQLDVTVSTAGGKWLLTEYFSLRTLGEAVRAVQALRMAHPDKEVSWSGYDSVIRKTGSGQTRPYTENPEVPRMVFCR